MNKQEEIGATLCDNCDKIIYESEFNLINDEDVVCDDCKKQERIYGTNKSKHRSQ